MFQDKHEKKPIYQPGPSEKESDDKADQLVGKTENAKRRIYEIPIKEQTDKL